MNKYKTVIGIEIHLELLTKTKMFSNTINSFGSKPNININEVDMGYPGAMPTVNKKAVEFAIMLAKALNMKIDNELHFDRKHYFYPDLPKGYQITQQFRPIGKNGYIFLPISNKTIKIERIHLEEDTAKQIHKGEYSYFDFNRAGVPLIEIVTKPELSGVDDAIEYVKQIQSLAKELGISNAKMEKGSLRTDINISISKLDSKQLGTKVEIKNLNSFLNIKNAIINEEKSQINSLENGIPINMTTKRFSEASKENIIMREKTDAIDYKYFPDSNIPPIKLSREFIDSIKLPTLPWERQEIYFKNNLNPKMIEQLMSNQDLANYFNSFEYKDKLTLAKIIFSEILPIVNKEKIKFVDLKINKKLLLEAIDEFKKSKITRKHLHQMILLLDGSRSIQEIISENKMHVISSEIEIKKIIMDIVDENKELITNKKDKKNTIVKIIMSLVMKKTKGHINPLIAKKAIDSYLKNK